MVLHEVLRNAAFTPKCLDSPFLVPGRYKHLTGYYCRVTSTLQNRHTKSALLGGGYPMMHHVVRLHSWFSQPY